MLMSLVSLVSSSVRYSISLLTSSKSVYSRLPLWENVAHSLTTSFPAASFSLATLTSVSSSGVLVTMPVPLGRKSFPTMFSMTDDLPEDCDPTTTYVNHKLANGIRVYGNVGCGANLQDGAGAEDPIPLTTSRFSGR